MSKYIVFDLETIYLAEKKLNKIIEIGFLIIHNNEVVGKYTRLIKPGEKINHFVEKLTSITNEELVNQPSFKEVYHEFLPLFKDHILVAHQAELDMKTINDELHILNLPALENKTIDTVELSKILLPELTSYKLTDLAMSLDFKFDNHKAHRALADAEITTKLFLLLKEKLLSLPKDSLQHLKQLLPYLISDLDHLFSNLSNHDNNEIKYSYYNDLPYLALLNFKKRNERLIDYDLFLTKMYKTKGLLDKVYGNYVYRENQVKISENIKHLFDKHEHGLIEAPTGIGKSIGYLIPVIYSALQNHERIVISTHTTHLQSQLMLHEIAKLNLILPFELNVQILKGKKNYIDVKRFYRFLKNKRNDAYPLIIFKAKLIVWLTETNTGLFSDLNIEVNMEQYLFDVQTLERESPSSFYYFAFKKSFSADLVLINHALLIADMNSNNLLIPSYNKIIVDEAQQFKNLVVENKNILLSSVNFSPFLKYLIKKTEFYELRLLKQELINLINNLYKYSDTENEAEQTYLFSSKTHSFDVQNIILEDFNTLLGYFELSINKLKSDEKIEKLIVNEFINYQQSLINVINNLENNLSLFITLARKKNELTWSMYSQKDKTNDMLLSNFYKSKHSVVYLSATLTIRGSFSYILNQLKLEENTHTLQLLTPFNLSEQAKLIVPNDFPAIKNESEYLAALSELIYSINELINGGILTLFTSYKMLKATFYLLQEFIPEDMTLLAQGITHTSREQLIKEFKEKQPAILLGTDSFWEGVDIKGDLLTCLILTRLPFQQINHPTFKIEAERLENLNQNSFFEYALPEAVLKFRQGIGRLIRSENDKGFIFVLDNRLLNANYKKYFTESIFPIETNYLATKEIIERIEDLDKL